MHLRTFVLSRNTIMIIGRKNVNSKYVQNARLACFICQKRRNKNNSFIPFDAFAITIIKTVNVKCNL